MSRKDYELIAEVIKSEIDEWGNFSIDNGANRAAELALKALACKLSTVFQDDNSRFSPERFMEAAGVNREPLQLRKVA